MRYTLSAGTYLGIPVRIHFTFPLILVVFGVEAWARGGWSDAVQAIVLILAVFVCVVLHEFGHSLQVRRYGIEVRDIVLLPIGGMARAERIPEKPRQEIVVAISGPLVNFALVVAIVAVMFLRGTNPLLSDGFLVHLLLINLVLGTFNLVPAFPMDGGRILRGILATRMPYLRATRIARNVGQLIAIVFAIVGFLNSSLIMLPVIAVFIFMGARHEEQLVRVRHHLADRQLGDYIESDSTVLRIDEPISAAGDLVSQGRGAFPVTDAGSVLAAAVPIAAARRALRDGRGDSPLGTLALYDFPVLRAETPAIQAYYLLKARRRPYAGVMGARGFIGLVHADEFLEGQR